MLLIALEDGPFKIAALGKESNGQMECSVLDFLQEVPEQFRASAEGFRSLFEQYALYGKQGVSDQQFHEANKQEGIWRFSKGRLRVYCFKDPLEKRLVLLTHASIKKKQGTEKKDVNAAIRARDDYLKAKEGRSLVETTIREHAGN